MIEDHYNQSKDDVSRIPKRIIQFWHDKKQLPAVYREAMNETIKNNSDYEYMFVDDDYIHELLARRFDATLCRLYRLNQIPASRSDIARLVVLYEFGGIYLDAAMEVHGSLNQIQNENAQVLLLQRDDLPKYQICPGEAHVVNGIIAAVPKSPFIFSCINSIIKNLISGKYNEDVLAATCLVLNTELDEYEKICSIHKIILKQLKKGFLRHIRIKGLRNSWKPLEKNGIIDLDQL